MGVSKEFCLLLLARKGIVRFRIGDAELASEKGSTYAISRWELCSGRVRMERVVVERIGN